MTQLFDLVVNSEKTRTSIPKEIKFLKPHYPVLVKAFEECEQGENKRKFADFLSFISISLSENYERDSLRYYQEGSMCLDFKKLG